MEEYYGKFDFDHVLQGERKNILRDFHAYCEKEGFI
jgi:hypothetical protein